MLVSLETFAKKTARIVASCLRQHNMYRNSSFLMYYNGKKTWYDFSEHLDLRISLLLYVNSAHQLLCFQCRHSVPVAI